MPSMVLLDATPLSGTGCDRADTAYVRGLIDAFGHGPEESRPRLLVGEDVSTPPGFAVCRVRRRSGVSVGAMRHRRDGIHVPETEAADLVHLTSTGTVAASRQISTCHDLLPLRFPALTFGPGSSPARRRYNRFLEHLAWARLVIVPTHAAARDVNELLGIPEQRIRVIPFGAPPPGDPAPAGAVPATLLVVANREPHTNAALAIRALARTAPQHHARLAIVGIDDRRRRDRLGRLAAALGVAERTCVVGSPDAVRLAGLRRSATLALVPSRAEGVSVPALAALAAGLPVVASDLPELAEQLGDAGVRVRGFDPAAWAEALDALLDDAAARSALVERSHARARGLSWHESMNEIIGCYTEAGDG